MAGKRASHRRNRRSGRLMITAAALTAGIVASAIGINAATSGGDTHPVAAAQSAHSQAPAAKSTAGSKPAKPAPAAAPQHAVKPTPVKSIPKNDPSKGMVYTGLTAASANDACAGEFKVSQAGLCTHGPDMPPTSLDVHKSAAPAVAAVAQTPALQGGSQAPSAADLMKASPALNVKTGSVMGGANSPATADGGNDKVLCDGDGTSGNRVQVLYVHGPGQDRYSQYLASFKKWAADVDVIYDASAQQTGGDRHIRFVTDADCTAAVLDVELSDSALAEFGATNDALAAQGYNHKDRKYMMFADANVYCGIGTFAGDDRPGQDNMSNFGPSYGRNDSGCWSGFTAAHELGHNLGAVNNSAPYSSKAGHCVDTNDVMCYSDAPYYPQMQEICHDEISKNRLDCTKDNYFNTNPKPGSYLSSHWNIADNQFLIAGGGNPNPNPNPNPSPTPNPNPSPTPTPTGSTTGPEVTVSQVTENSAELSWSKADGAAGYEVRINGRAAGTVTSTAVRLVQLQADTDYQVAVAVKDQSGKTGEAGPTAAFHTLVGSGTTRPGTKYTMVNGLTGQAADMWGSSRNNGDVLIAYQQTGYANQQWLFEDAGNGTVRIKSALTEKCLQIGGQAVAGQFVFQQPCSNDAAQQWKVTAADAGFTVTSAGSSLVLGASDRWYYGGWLLELQQPDGQPYQNWAIQPVS